MNPIGVDGNNKARILLLVMILVGLSAWALLLYLPQSAPQSPPPPSFWIAHALGGIEGQRYTNSREAFALNYRRGFRLFEVDLLLTGDGHICAFSNVEPMTNQFGLSSRVAEVSHESFRKQRYFGQYEPICIEEITALMHEYPDATFILDVKDSAKTSKKEDMRLSEQAFKDIYMRLFELWDSQSDYWGRVIPQIYCENDLAFLKAHRKLPKIIYTLYRSDDPDDQVINFSHRNPEVVAITVSKKRLTTHLATAIREQGKDVLVHTINTPHELDRFLVHKATGFYTDFLLPESDH